MGTMANYSSLRLATVTLPKADNSGRATDFATAWLAKEICKAFGGVTVTEGLGMWVDGDGTVYRDPVNVFTVALNATASAKRKIRELALQAGEMADQLAMFATFDGEAMLLDVPAVRAKVAAAAE